MKEILGNNLKQVFFILDNQDEEIPVCTFRNNRYEVWEVPDKLFEDICGPLVFSDVNIQYIIAELKKRNIQFNTMAEFQKVVTQIQKVNKNTRKWSFKGYTENELALIPSKKLLGRNEPCLCGSGRKYKKCCGR